MILMKIMIFVHDHIFIIITRCEHFGAGVAVFTPTPGV